MKLAKLSQNLLHIILITALLGFSSISAQTDKKSKELLQALTTVNGGYQKLASKKDVSFTYVYDNFEKGKDVSTEKHIFNGEHSWAFYKQHDINVLAKQDGEAMQSFVDGKPQLTLNGSQITNAKDIGGTIFLRKVNSYWFTMMYKLEDPGTNYTYLGTEDVDGIIYDKVRLTYDAKVTNKEKNDEYILFFNPKTHIIDLFLFFPTRLGN